MESTNVKKYPGGFFRRRMAALQIADRWADAKNLCRWSNARKGSYALDGTWMDGAVSLTTQPIPIKAGETHITFFIQNAVYAPSSRLIVWSGGTALLVKPCNANSQTVEIPAGASCFTVSMNTNAKSNTNANNTMPIEVLCQAEWGTVATCFEPHPADVGNGTYLNY